MLGPCKICEHPRLVRCFGIDCCAECKWALAKRPADRELFTFVDVIYGHGVAACVHDKLYRFWYDRVGRDIENGRIFDRYKKRATLLDFCCDTIVQDPDLVANTYHKMPSPESPPWLALLQAWGRWKRVRIRTTRLKNAQERILSLSGISYL